MMSLSKDVAQPPVLTLPISLVAPVIGVSLAGLVALFWMLPWGPLDRFFLRCEGPEGE